MIYLVELKGERLFAIRRQNNIPGGILGYVSSEAAQECAAQFDGQVTSMSLDKFIALCMDLRLTAWIKSARGQLNYIEETRHGGAFGEDSLIAIS